MKKALNQTQLAHLLIAEFLDPTDTAIDATCGNGQDTLFLAEHLPYGKVIAFDIQEKALERTLEKLTEAHLKSRAQLCHASHAQFPEWIQPHTIDLFVYNLGYLPGADKKLSTQSATTLQSLTHALTLLAPDGAISLMLYPGHSEGEKEAQDVLNWASQLPSNKYQVNYMKLQNRKLAPELLWIKKTQTLHQF